MWTTIAYATNNSQLAGNACEEHIRFGGGVISGLPSGGTHIDFEMADGRSTIVLILYVSFHSLESRWIPGNIRKSIFS